MQLRLEALARGALLGELLGGVGARVVELRLLALGVGVRLGRPFLVGSPFGFDD